VYDTGQKLHPHLFFVGTNGALHSRTKVVTLFYSQKIDKDVNDCYSQTLKLFTLKCRLRFEKVLQDWAEKK
jgi:hypothetical protein